MSGLVQKPANNQRKDEKTTQMYTKCIKPGIFELTLNSKFSDVCIACVHTGKRENLVFRTLI